MLENDKSAGQRIWPVYLNLHEDDAQDGTKEMPTSSSLSSDIGTPRDYPSKFITSLKTSSCALYLLVELPPFTGSQKPLGGDVPFPFPLVSTKRNPMYNKELWIGTPLNDCK